MFAALAACAAFANAPIKPWPGGATPPLSLVGVDGRKVDLEALRGRVVVINFWATWCEPCRDEMPSLQRLQARMKDQPLDVVAVNYGESGAKVAAFAARLGLSIPLLLDREKRSAEAWKVRGLPMTFLVDARGEVRHWSFGERDWSEGEALRLVEQMVSDAANAGR